MTLRELAQQVHEANRAKGFYEEYESMVGSIRDRNYLEEIDYMAFGQRIALIHSELSEALEAHRGRRKFVGDVHNRNNIISFEGEEFNSIFRELVKDTWQDEIADAFIRILDFCGATGMDLDFHVRAKLKYNKNRPHKHGKEY